MSTCLCKLDEARHEPREQLFLYTKDLRRERVGMLCYLTRKTICPFCTRATPLASLRMMDLGSLSLFLLVQLSLESRALSFLLTNLFWNWKWKEKRIEFFWSGVIFPRKINI